MVNFVVRAHDDLDYIVNQYHYDHLFDIFEDFKKGDLSKYNYLTIIDIRTNSHFHLDHTGKIYNV